MNKSMGHKKANTRDRIIAASVKLFAEQGFDGTTIRNIAEMAEVNVALINYHFENKQNLYVQVVKDNWQRLDLQIEELARSCHANTDLFARKMFLLLKTHSHEAMNSFKILLNENVQISTPIVSSPPGGLSLLRIIREEVGDKIAEDACQWAMRSILIQVLHLGIMTSSVIARNQTLPHFSTDNIKLHLSIFVKAILSYVRQNPKALYSIRPQSF